MNLLISTIIAAVDQINDIDPKAYQEKEELIAVLGTRILMNNSFFHKKTLDRVVDYIWHAEENDLSRAVNRKDYLSRMIVMFCNDGYPLISYLDGFHRNEFSVKEGEEVSI